MINRRYATWDEFIIGPGLETEEGDLVLKTAFATPDPRRCARSSIGQGNARVSDAEFFFTSPNFASGLIDTLPSLVAQSGVPPLLLGVCKKQASLSKYLGGDTSGIGWDPYTGDIYNNDVVVDNIGTATWGDSVRIVLDVFNGTLQFVKNGNPLGHLLGIDDVQALWFFAGGVSGNPGDMVITAATGKTRFWHPYANLTGWWEPLASVPPINLATEPWMAAATDTRRHEIFEGDIDHKAQPMEIADGMWFWMWGSSAPDDIRSGGLVQMKINDPQGVYDGLRADNARNSPVPIWRVPHDQTFDGEAELLFTGLLDHCDADTRQTKQLYVRDQSNRLAVPLKRALYPPGIDPAFAGRARSSHMGICRNYEGDLIDAVNGVYGLHDGALTAFGRNRAQGKPIFLGIDLSQLDDLSGVKSVVPLVGKVTFESTSYGGALNPDGVDYLGGAGTFGSAAAGAGGHPANWTGWVYNGSVAGDFQLVGASPNKLVRWRNDPAAVKGFYPTTNFTIKKGRTYAFKLHVDAVPYIGPATDPVTGAQFDIGPASFVFGWPQDQRIEFFNFAKVQLTNGGLFEGTFTNRTGEDKSIAFGFLCNALIPGTGIGDYFDFDIIALEELPPVADDVEFTGGPGLTQMVNMIAVERGDFDTTEISTFDSDLIDQATGYLYGLGVASNESPPIGDCLTSVLDPSTSSYYFDATGELRFFRLFKPEDFEDDLIDGELGTDDFTGGLKEYEDLAEGLRTRISGRRNYSPIGASEYGPTTLDQVPLNERALLAQKFQWTKTAQGVQLAQRYLDAIDRDPFESSLDREEDGVHAISYGCGFYQVNRSFYVGTAFEYGRTFNLGAVWRTTYDLPALKTGQKLLIVARRRQPDRNLCKLYLWGIGKED